tara:strand:+ start:269 stop:1519 length:1251 start_codon:yes stop_codon:yes gene_type:complete
MIFFKKINYIYFYKLVIKIFELLTIKIFSKKSTNRFTLILLIIAPQLFTLDLAGPPLLDKDKVSNFRKIYSMQINSIPYKMRIACKDYESFENIDLIALKEIRLPDKCFGKNIDISFKVSKKYKKNYHYPYGNLLINFSNKFNDKVILTTNLRPSYKAESSNLYSYRLNSENRFTIKIKESSNGSLFVMANEYCSNFDKRNPVCLAKTENLKKYESEFIGLNYILGIYTDAGKSCSNISSQLFFPSYTGVDSVLPKSYEDLVSKHLNVSTRIFCIHHVDELVEKGIIPSITLNHSLIKEGISKNVPVSFTTFKKDRINKVEKIFSNIYGKDFTNNYVKFIPGEEKSILISKDPYNSNLTLYFDSINQERILFTGIPFSNSHLLDLDSWEKIIINDAFLGIIIPPNINEINIKSRTE